MLTTQVLNHLRPNTKIEIRYVTLRDYGTKTMNVDAAEAPYFINKLKDANHVEMIVSVEIAE